MVSAAKDFKMLLVNLGSNVTGFINWRWSFFLLVLLALIFTFLRLLWIKILSQGQQDIFVAGCFFNNLSLYVVEYDERVVSHSIVEQLLVLF